MMNILANTIGFNILGGGGGSGVTDFDINNISVRYNNTPYSYLTSAPFADTASFVANSNVISVTTIVPDEFGGQDNANTGLTYDLVNDEFLVKELGTNDIIRFNRALVEQGRIQGVGTQGIAMMSEDRYVLEYENDIVRAFDMSGNLLNTQSMGSGGTAGSIFYDEKTNRLYLSHGNQTSRLRIYNWSGSWTGTAWTLEQELWYGSKEGSSVDPITGQVLTIPSSTSGFKLSDFTGFNMSFYPLPTAGTAAVTEATVIDPIDRTLWFNSDEHFHGSIVGGNRLWRVDPLGVYHRTLYLREKHFKDYISPVVDFDAYTLQQTGSNWSATNRTLEYRGSNSAPTTTSNTQAHLAVYDANNTNYGWGATVPSDWQSTPGTWRYMQIRVVDETTPNTLWTPNNLGSKLRVWLEAHQTNNMSILPNTTTVTGITNLASPLNSFSQSTGAQRGSYNVAGYLSMSTNQNYAAVDPTYLTDQQGSLVIVGKRRAIATTNALYLACSNTASDNNIIQFRHERTGDATMTNGVNTVFTDNVGAANKYGTANSVDAFKKIKFESNGSTSTLHIDNVSQTVTTVLGSNTGQWFGDCTGATESRINLVDRAGTTLTGQTDIKFMLLTNSPLTTQEEADLDDYLDRMGIWTN